MSTLILQGETLGQKHQHYNKLLNEVTSTNTSQEIKKINYNDPDIDNLFKIDIASKKKDVDYILEVFKCEDILYVSRALKQSVWLVTDIKYADIVNPDYVHSQLLPQMTCKAGRKLLLNIRLNLKHEKRVELFHRYYEDKKEFKTAHKWLQNCSISYIETVLEKRGSDIPNSLIKRLCERSIKVLEICARKADDYNMRALLSTTTFLLNNDAEKFVSIVNSQDKYALPRFSAKATKTIMKTKPDIVLDNFEKFATKIDTSTFIKFLKSEEIKDFLMKHFDNKKLKSWFTFDTMKYFIFRMPSDSRFDFIKRVFIEKPHDTTEEIAYEDDYIKYATLDLYCTSQSVAQSSNANIYKWYKFAPFSVAFTDLKKLIRVESNPSERNEIFAVLINCAKRNSQNLLTILQYYRDKHMNEPFKFKSHFVNIVLSQSNSHRLDEKCWSILNDIFCSMEVYTENENNVQSCLKHIIIYKSVHDTTVPDIVQKKFEFDTLKSFQSKLNDEEKVKVFKYLYQFMIMKIQNITVNSESDLKTVKEHIISVLNLLNDWKKNLLDYSIVLEKIREVIKINGDKSWNEDLSGIYMVNKAWRKHMFKESLLLNPNQETCVNALKHGPEILTLSKDNICSNDSLLLSLLLGKLRIYWPQTLGKAFEDTFRNQLDNKAKHKISIRGLCVLLPQNQLIDILKKYTPTDTKINWSETDDLTFNIQKCFAKYMHLARPHPPVQHVLLYAKGDYLQFALPSVHSILFDISSNRSVEHISTLLDAPVSLQKHGLKIAFTKLKVDELLSTSLNTWKSTKNSSIRATIFKLVFELLCKEQNENEMVKIWHVLDTFISSLTCDENKIIYVTLGQAKKVPLPVKQAYCIKSYRYLKSLPPKSNCNQFADSVIRGTLDIIETLDVQFVNEVIFDSFEENFTKQYYNFANVISAYLLSTKCEATQTQRYEQIFVPLLQRYLAFVHNTENNLFHLKYNFNDVLKQIHEDFEQITIKKNMITPIKLFNDIHNDLEKNFSNEENYVLVMTWKLAALYIQVMEKYRVRAADISTEDQSENEFDKLREKLHLEAVPDFATVCVKLLKEETTRYFPSVYRLFSKALNEIFQRFNIMKNTKLQLATLKEIQEHADIIEAHLLVVKLLPDYLYENEEKEERAKIYKVLNSHQSAEVRMHYQQMLRKLEKYE